MHPPTTIMARTLGDQEPNQSGEIRERSILVTPRGHLWWGPGREEDDDALTGRFPWPPTKIAGTWEDLPAWKTSRATPDSIFWSPLLRRFAKMGLETLNVYRSDTGPVFTGTDGPRHPPNVIVILHAFLVPSHNLTCGATCHLWPFSDLHAFLHIILHVGPLCV